jgi:uncharacterized membrane protein YjjP (DUF1212 family)
MASSMTPRGGEFGALQVFVVRLGAALSSVGVPTYSVQARLGRVARAYGAHHARISAFPTYMLVSMGAGEPATVELTTSLAAPHLDQIARLDTLATAAEQGTVELDEGLRQLGDIMEMDARFGWFPRVIGYATLTLGLCLILHPALREIAAAAILGAIVGVLRSFGKRSSPLEVLMPVIAAFVVSSLSALAVREDLTGPGLRAMVASLVVFLPGTALTNSVLELAAGQTVSGASRLVSGVVELALLAFGIVAGLSAFGELSPVVFAGSGRVLGAWAPWLGVLIFAIGVSIANSAPAKSFLSLLMVLYAAWIGQVAGNAILGGYVSAFVGALVMTLVAFWVARLPSAMPQFASFLPGFWLLVPGALGLIGLTELAVNPGGAGAQDLIATVVTLFAIAVGVLFGTLLLDGFAATGRLVDDLSETLESKAWIARVTPRSRRERKAKAAEADDPAGENREP